MDTEAAAVMAALGEATQGGLPLLREPRAMYAHLSESGALAAGWSPGGNQYTVAFVILSAECDCYLAQVALLISADDVTCTQVRRGLGGSQAVHNPCPYWECWPPLGQLLM